MPFRSIKPLRRIGIDEYPREMLIYRNASPAVLTSTTNETVLASCILPAGIMGPNGILHINAIYENSASANNKIGTIRIGTSFAQSQIYYNAGSTTVRAVRAACRIYNRNNEASQVGGVLNSFGGIGGTTGSTDIRTSSYNTADELLIMFSGTLANAADSITLHAFDVSVIGDFVA